MKTIIYILMFFSIFLLSVGCCPNTNKETPLAKEKIIEDVNDARIRVEKTLNVIEDDITSSKTYNKFKNDSINNSDTTTEIKEKSNKIQWATDNF